MNERIFYSEYFYQKGSNDTDVLEKNANEYPYSSLASFLLLYHYKKTADPAFEKYAKKTVLLFNNPHWLQFQLFDKSAPNPEPKIINDESFSNENEIKTNDNNEIHLEPSSVENIMEELVQNHEAEIINDENFCNENELTTKDNKEITLEPSSVENIMEESVQTPEPEIINDESFRNENEITTKDNNEIHLESSFVENITAESDAVSEDSTLNSQDIEIIEKHEPINDEAIAEPLREETPQQENKDAIMENAGTQNENIVNESEVIAFEPLHTVDYFASQGIKITEELLTKDKLGSQMKSFTAWLKSMKKLHPGKLEEQSLATEKLIQASANESNFNTEILTEAMAEVLIKQDKKEKAIEMFSKLSLINPSKSAYFAARIESIKSN